jgi:anti-anti-sigma regulatory factor
MQPDSMPTSIHLPPLLDLAAAEPLRRALAAAIADGGIALDGAAVERVATPCLQILAAAAAACAKKLLPFRLHHPSGALNDAITDLGLRQAIPIGD